MKKGRTKNNKTACDQDEKTGLSSSYTPIWIALFSITLKLDGGIALDDSPSHQTVSHGGVQIDEGTGSLDSGDQLWTTTMHAPLMSLPVVSHQAALHTRQH